MVINNVQKSVYSTVNRCLEKYVGGEIFFDELDNALKFDRDMLVELLQKTKLAHPHSKIIASGEIGLCLHNFQLPVDIIVQGGLRNDKAPLSLKKFVNEGELYTFVDDSYFSGKTARIVKEALEKEGCYFDGVSVIYDGCKEKKDNVMSMYRYYDHH